MADIFHYGQMLKILLDGVETLVQFESYSSSGDIFVRLSEEGSTTFMTIPVMDILETK